MGNPVVHFEIGCRDKDATAAFYESCFGWTAEDYGPSTKSFTTGAPDGIQGHLTALGHEPHAYVLVYVEVDDVAAALEKIELAGGESLIGPLPVPGQNRSFAWFKDPAGNTLGLIGRKGQ